MPTLLYNDKTSQISGFAGNLPTSHDEISFWLEYWPKARFGTLSKGLKRPGFPPISENPGLLQWTWRESNPRPKASPPEHLPSQPFLLTFPPLHGKWPPCSFSSFILRPLSQSFDSVVSYDHDAGIREHRYNRADERP